MLPGGATICSRKKIRVSPGKDRARPRPQGPLSQKARLTTQICPMAGPSAGGPPERAPPRGPNRCYRCFWFALLEANDFLFRPIPMIAESSLRAPQKEFRNLCFRGGPQFAQGKKIPGFARQGPGAPAAPRAAIPKSSCDHPNMRHGRPPNAPLPSPESFGLTQQGDTGIRKR